MDITEFRTQFPEFQDAAKYPDAQLTFWSTIAELQVSVDAWKSMRPCGVKLYVAHEVTLAAQNVSAANVGGTPGSQGGIANSKTVGSVSVGYDASTTTEKDAGWWNLTNYGKQYYRLLKMFGAGALQL